jgi:hypothetical protein
MRPRVAVTGWAQAPAEASAEFPAQNRIVNIRKRPERGECFVSIADAPSDYHGFSRHWLGREVKQLWELGTCVRDYSWNSLYVDQLTDCHNNPIVSAVVTKAKRLSRTRAEMYRII